MQLRNLFLVSIIVAFIGFGCINNDSSIGPEPITSNSIYAELSVDYFDLVLRDDTIDVNVGYKVEDSIYFAEDAEYFFNVIYPKKDLDSNSVDYDTTDFLNGNHTSTKQIGSFSDKLPASYFYDTEFEGMTLQICMHRRTIDTTFGMTSMLYFLALDLDS